MADDPEVIQAPNFADAMTRLPVRARRTFPIVRVRDLMMFFCLARVRSSCCLFRSFVHFDWACAAWLVLKGCHSYWAGLASLGAE